MIKLRAILGFFQIHRKRRAHSSEAKQTTMNILQRGQVVLPYELYSQESMLWKVAVFHTP